MVQRAERLSHFEITAFPDADRAVEVLCEDHVGTYLLPFACRHVREGWISASDARPLVVTVVGWREVRSAPRARPVRPS